MTIIQLAAQRFDTNGDEVWGHPATGIAGTDGPMITQLLADTPEGGVARLPAGLFALSGEVAPTKRGSLVGSGVHQVYDSNNVQHISDVPRMSPYLAGTVLMQTVAGANGITLSKAGKAFNLRHFGVRFDDSIRFRNTGHGISARADTTYNGFRDIGMVSSEWEDLIVWGHDGNDHYGYDIANSVYMSLKHLRSFGGGILRLEGSIPSWNTGNMTIDHISGSVICNSLSHGYYIFTANGATINLLSFIRPQCIMGPSTAFPDAAGFTSPLLTQHIWKSDGPGVGSLSILHPDLESGSLYPVRFGVPPRSFISPGGIHGNSADTIGQDFNVFSAVPTGDTLNSDLRLGRSPRGTPTVTPTASAGVGATVTISGDNARGKITLTTGSSGVGGAGVILVNWTFAGDFLVPPKAIVFSPGNAAAAAVRVPWSPGALVTDLRCGGDALAPSTAYVWHYMAYPDGGFTAP